MWRCLDTGAAALSQERRPQSDDLLAERLGIFLMPIDNATKNTRWRPGVAMPALVGKMAGNTSLICATDGSYEGGAAGWGVCIVTPEGEVLDTHHSKVLGAEQSSAAVEAYAIECVLTANRSAGVRQITFIVDNLQVVKAVQALIGGSVYVPHYSFGSWRHIRELMSGVEVECHWPMYHRTGSIRSGVFLCNPMARVSSGEGGTIRQTELLIKRGR